MHQYNLPKGPVKNKLFQMLQFIRQPKKLLDDCRKTYGKTFLLRLLGQPHELVFISDPQDLKQVLTAKSEQLGAGELSSKMIEPIFGNSSLLVLGGEKHLSRRKLILPCFHGERMKVYGELMKRITERAVSKWKSDEIFSFMSQARNITFDIVLTAIFGMNEENPRYKTLQKSLEQLLDHMKKPFSTMILSVPFLQINLGPLTPWAKMMKLRRAVDICLFEEIETRKKMDLNSLVDILSLLLKARDDDGNSMTAQEIRDEMITLLITGHDSSSVAITWTLYEILSNDNVLKKIKEEFSEVISEKNDWVAHLDKLVYLDAVIKESLRIMPLVPFVARVTREENYQLGEYTVPKGTVIMSSFYLTHHDAEFWPDPNKFLPERFFDTTEAPYTYLPFGAGTRRCVGPAFAQYEMKIVIMQILLQAELALKENYVPKFKRNGVVIAPSEGLPVILKKNRTDKAI